tara:strand:- start:88 stop:696 length:609 start_codon:yes stop_codon:yes gene_type:complete
MIEHKFPKESLIGGWYIPEKICDDLITYYEDNTNLAHSGQKIEKNSNVEIVNDMRMPLDKSNPHISFRNYVMSLQEVLNNYTLKYDDSQRLPVYELEQHTNLQKYEPGQGYKVWHFEDDGKILNTALGNARRLLVFMTYLNDVDDGGTEFKYQNIITPAKKGLTLIWPAPWTHTHRGQISNTKTKYITTGWFSYMEKEDNGE